MVRCRGSTICQMISVTTSSPTSSPTVAYSFHGSRVCFGGHSGTQGQHGTTAIPHPLLRTPPLTFRFSFFSSFLVKTVWTHQILVNMLP